MFEDNFYLYIRSINIDKSDIDNNIYPFNLIAVKSLNTLKLNSEVSFIVGENGSGKSTILEAIAVAYGFNPEGGSKNFNFETSNTHSNLSDFITLSKGITKAKDGYFLRAESFYNVATNVDELDKLGPISLLDSYGGKSLHEQSHGESFLALVINRFTGKGLYILDEPEAALSPSRQMVLIRRIHELVREGSQFIIATHSPILMSYPNSTIYDIESGYKEVSLEDTEHFQITRKFINDRESMLDILLKD